MYSSISVRGFRCLEDFRMEGLGRVNLLVGTNNCGKTTVLESVQLLSAPSPYVLPALAIRRGESRSLTEGELGRAYAVHILQLFACRDLAGEVIVAADRCTPRLGEQERSTDKVRLRINDAPNEGPSVDGQTRLFGDPDLHEDVDGVVLQACWSVANNFSIALTADGEMLMRSRQLRRARDAHNGARVIGSNGMTPAQVIALLDDVVLSENEEQVTNALHILEPRVERVASIASERDLSRGGPVDIFVKLKGVEKRVPIGSTGDGMWRMLGIALMLAKAQGGVLLVDEIDAGLHYTVMESMWRMVCEQAAALSVQVFATTHSRDCYEALVAVVKAEAVPTEGVTIQRIEQRRKQAVAISGDAIAVVAERGLEVR